MKKAYSFRLSDDTILAIRVAQKELGLKSEAAAIEARFGVSSNGRTTGFEPVRVGSIPAAPAMPVGYIAPKGSHSIESLKALLAGSRVGKSEAPRDEVQPFGPHAPFDFNDEEGNPHRVRAYGKTLKVCFLRDGVEEPIRNLREGELEILWEKRVR